MLSTRNNVPYTYITKEYGVQSRWLIGNITQYTEYLGILRSLTIIILMRTSALHYLISRA